MNQVMSEITSQGTKDLRPRSSPGMRVMNAVLWILQVLSGVFWSITGFGKIFWYIPALWNQALREVPWLSGVPQGLIILIGALEFLGGIGLILPAMTRVKPKLTPYAAFALTLVMILAAGFHMMRGEYSFLSLNLVLGGITALIGFGRLWVRPVAQAPIGAFRAVFGVLVLCALAVLGYAPVWYRLAHMN